MLRKLLFILILSTSLFATKVTLYVACDLEPYSYCVEGGEPQGININILKSIFSKIDDYELEFKGMKAQHLLEMAQKGEQSEINVIGTLPLKPSQPYISKYSRPYFFKMNKDLEQIKGCDGNISWAAISSGDPLGYAIGFTLAPYPQKEDLLQKINLAIRIMSNSNEMEKILHNYFNCEDEKLLTISLYNWGKNLISQSYEGYGIIPEIITSAFKSMNIDVKYEFYHFNHAFLLAKWGKVCATATWLDIGDRRNYMYYSDALVNAKVYLYYNKNRFPQGITFNDYFDLIEYKIGGVTGYYYEKEFFDSDKLMRYSSYPTLPDAIHALLTQEIDIVLAEYYRFDQILNESFADRKHEIGFHPKPLFIQNNYLLFSKYCKNGNALRDKFNLGLLKIKENGTFDKILNRYNIIDKSAFIDTNIVDKDIKTFKKILSRNQPYKKQKMAQKKHIKKRVDQNLTRKIEVVETNSSKMSRDQNITDLNGRLEKE